MNDSAFQFEIKRKVFHLYSLIFPLLYLFVEKIYMSLFLMIITAFALYLDITRHYNKRIHLFTDKFFGKFMRSSEISGSFKLSGASFMAIGFLLTAILFSKGLAITSWIILSISDFSAAIVGIRIGSRIIYGKSIEGSAAFLISAFIVSILSYFFIGYSTSFATMAISCLVATFAELFAKEINVDDNVLIPVSYCISTVIFNFILGI